MTEPNKGQKLRAANGSGRKKGDTAITSPALKAIRAQAILEARVKGVPVGQLAAQYKVSEKTIYRLLNWAKEEGLLGELKQRALEKLGSLSLDVYEAAMKADTSTLTQSAVEAHKMKLTAAKDVAFGAGILNKKPEQRMVEEEHSMEWFLKQRSHGGESAGEEEGSDGPNPVLDGVVLSEQEGTENPGAGDEQNRLQEWTDGGTGPDGSGEGRSVYDGIAEDLREGDE